MIVSASKTFKNSRDEICTYCNNVCIDEEGKISGCKFDRKNSGNNKIICVECRKFSKAPHVEIPYLLRKEIKIH